MLSVTLYKKVNINFCGPVMTLKLKFVFLVILLEVISQAASNKSRRPVAHEVHHFIYNLRGAKLNKTIFNSCTPDTIITG